MKTAQEYKDSLRERKIRVYIKGELQDPKTLIDHPFIRGHVNSAAMTYALANSAEYGDLCSATSHLTGHPDQSVYPYPPVHGGSDHQSEDVADDLPEDRYLLPAVCGL